MSEMLTFSLVFSSAVCGLSLPLSPIHVHEGNFVDQDGRVRMFRGINSVIKHYPWYDSKLLEAERQEQLGDWGFTAVRLGSMWSGVEPVEGQINETYINILTEIVTGLEKKGIYSYLDMHQDVLIEEAEYDGIPAWLSSKFSPSTHAYPWPLNNTEGFTTWACGYFTEKISNSFQQLYTHHQPEFARVWREIALRFRDKSAVLGYELMNEPWTGDFYQDLSLLLPGNAGYELLEPFYNWASAAIREVDDEKIIFWEPVTYSYFINLAPNLIIDTVLDAFFKSHDYTLFLPVLKEACGDLADDVDLEDGGSAKLVEAIISQLVTMVHKPALLSSKSGKPSSLGPGFTSVPGGAAYLNRTVLSYHYYCWALGYGSDQHYDPELRILCDQILSPLVFSTVAARASELGGSATMLTEFGECSPSYDHPDYQGTIECNAVLQETEKHLQSWSYWDSASGGVLWDSQGNVNTEAVKIFSRPYPQATAGIPLSLSYDPYSRVMEFHFLPNLQILSATEIFVPPLVYTAGYNVEVSAGLEWETKAIFKNKILVTAFSDEEGVVRITPQN